MSTGVDDIGRTYDVLAFRGAVPRGEVLLDQSLADDESGGAVCAGAQKLAQCFLIELLTQRGTFPYDPPRGTTFMTELGTGRLRTETDVFVAFNFAVGDIKATLRDSEADAAPPDERLRNAELTRVVLLPGYAQLHIALTSQAGTARPIILPIATTPGGPPR